MSAGKVPPRVPSRPSSVTKSPSAKSAPAKRRELNEDAAPTTKKTSEPDNLGALDYLVEYKEVVLALVVGLIGYGTYAYFQPYFAAQEAAKQKPVISAQLKNEVAPPPTGVLRETVASNSNTVAPSARQVTPGITPVTQPQAGLSEPVASTTPAKTYAPRKIEYLQPTSTPVTSTTTSSPKVYIPVTAGTSSSGKPTISGTIPSNPTKPSPENRQRPGF